MTTTTNSSDTKSFTDRMREQLTDLRDSVDRTLADMEEGGAEAGAKASDALRTRRDEAQAGIEARRQDMESANARMKVGLEAKKTGAEATIAEWKAKLDLHRLEGRAEHAEEYATATTLFAWGAAQEASAAILEAIVARADAEEAKVKHALTAPR